MDRKVLPRLCVPPTRDAAESRDPATNFKFPGASVLQLIGLLSASGRDICVHSVLQSACCISVLPEHISFCSYKSVFMFVQFFNDQNAWGISQRQHLMILSVRTLMAALSSRKNLTTQTLRQPRHSPQPAVHHAYAPIFASWGSAVTCQQALPVGLV